MNRHERRKQASWARKDPRLKGMDIRYGGRTLSFQVFVNTDEEAEPVAWRIKAKAPGPKQVMTIVAAEEPRPPEITAPLWENQGIPTLFGGRTLIIQVCVNTDEDEQLVSRRILDAARAPEGKETEATLRKFGGVSDAERVSLAVVIAGGEVEPAAAKQLWEAMFTASEKTVENEN